MNSAPAPAPGPGPAGSDNRDYLDKALDAAEKKSGGQRFADPNKNRGMNEKITDFIRKMVEKVTGYDTLCLDPNFWLFCREARFSGNIGWVDGCCCCCCCCLLLSCDADTRCVCIGRRCLLNSPIEQLHDGPYQDLQAARAGVLYTKDTHNERVVLCARERVPAIITC